MKRRSALKISTSSPTCTRSRFLKTSPEWRLLTWPISTALPRWPAPAVSSAWPALKAGTSHVRAPLLSTSGAATTSVSRSMLVMTRRVIGRRASGVGVVGAGAQTIGDGVETAVAEGSAAGGCTAIFSNAGEEPPPVRSKKLVPTRRAVRTSRLPRLLENLRMEMVSKGARLCAPLPASVGVLADGSQDQQPQIQQ